MVDDIRFTDPHSPSFLVRRGVGGDYVRAGSLAGLAGRATVLRYEVKVPDTITDALFLSQPVGYDGIQVWWGVPPSAADAWTSVCVVRSGFGNPSTLADGEILHHFRRPDTPDDDPDKPQSQLVPGTFIDRGLPSGRWFYYTLFFRIGTSWIAANTTESLVPVDYHHREHLLDLVPPFYLKREVDDSYNFITRWMTMIGYDLDYTRTLAEGVQDIYDPDSAPQALLDAMGQDNLGFKKPSALGDIRYRSVLANNRAILWSRGTLFGLETYIEAAFKSTVTTTNGLNELLLVDDAEFHTGVGDWAPMPWRISYALATSTYGGGATTATNAFHTRGVEIEAFGPPPDLGPTFSNTPDSLPPVPVAGIWPLPKEIPTARGVCRIKASGGDQLAITCGAGIQDVIIGVDSVGLQLLSDERHLDAFYRGVPVDPSSVYYFSFWSRRDPGNIESDVVVYGLAQYDKEPGTQGFSDGFRAVSTVPANAMHTKVGFSGWQARLAWADELTTPKSALQSNFRPPRVGTNSDGWEHHVASFATDAKCRYVVPFIWFKSTTSWATPITTPRYITAVMVSPAQIAGVSQLYGPDAFLRMIDQPVPSRHLIGGIDDDQPEGTRDDYKVIGETP